MQKETLSSIPLDWFISIYRSIVQGTTLESFLLYSKKTSFFNKKVQNFDSRKFKHLKTRVIISRIMLKAKYIWIIEYTSFCYICIYNNVWKIKLLCTYILHYFRSLLNFLWILSYVNKDVCIFLNYFDHNFLKL